MIATKHYQIINRDPDHFRMVHFVLPQHCETTHYLKIAQDTFDETLRAFTDKDFELSSIHLEVFTKILLSEDILSESMVYHMEEEHIKVHLYLYSKSNKMLCQANAQYYLEAQTK